MSTRTIQFSFKYGGSLTDPDSVVLSDEDGSYGIKRNDTGATVVSAGTAMTKTATGEYEYEFTEPASGLTYTAWVKSVYRGATYYTEIDVELAISDSMEVSYSSLVEIVGRRLYGIRSGFSTAQLADINDCIRHGLQAVYTAYPWSFLRPRQVITTSEPYTTGTVEVSSGVVTLTGGTFPSWAASGVLAVESGNYRISSRDSDTQITLEDTSVDVDSGTSYTLGRPEYDLPSGFDAIIGEELMYEPEASSYYPPIPIIHEQKLRRYRQDEEYTDRPLMAAVVTVEYDPTVGSRRRLLLYPTPDDVYVLIGRMRLRPTMISDSNPYPIGGEILSQVIIEACLAAGERLLEENEGVYAKHFQELLAAAIAADQDATSPSELGPDKGGEERLEWPPTILVGAVTIDDVEM